MSYTLHPITNLAGCTHFQTLERIVWGSDETEVVPNHVLVTVVQNGGGLIGAYADDGPGETGGLVGAVFWWLGTTKAGALKVCSHIAGVHPAWQGRGIGAALKWAQRDAVLDQGLTEHVTWTYDPLIAANGAFNLRKLGATCRTYKRNVYGKMKDALNRGIPSDRCQVDWWLCSERVVQASQGIPQQAVPETVTMWPTLDGADGLPVPASGIPDFDGSQPLAVPLPGDLDAMRQANPPLVMTWRLHLRTIFEAAFAANYALVDCTRLHGRWHYLLTPGSVA